MKKIESFYSAHPFGKEDCSRSIIAKLGFTLAEVILVIGIVGVIAALTIPMLIQKSNDKELVTGFLKAHSILFNALKQAEVLEETKVNKIASEGDFFTFFEKYLKKMGKCDWDVCLLDNQRYDYYGEFHVGCDYVVDGYTNALKESCIKLVVDVNGRRGPNLTGKDIFGFWVTRTGVYPEGGTEACNNMDCGAYILTHHKLYSNANPQKYFHPIAHCSTYDENGCTSCREGYFVNKGGGSCVEKPSFCTVADGKNCTLSDGNTVVYALGDKYVATAALAYVGNSCNAQYNDGTTKGCAEYAPSGKISVPGSGYADEMLNDYHAGAVSYCDSVGMALPTKAQMTALYEECSSSDTPSGICPGSGTYWTYETTLDEGTGYTKADTINFSNGTYRSQVVGLDNGIPGVFCVEKDSE